MGYSLGPAPFWSLIDSLGLFPAGTTLTTYDSSDKSSLKAVYKDSSAVNVWENPIEFDSVSTDGPFFWDEDNAYYLVFEYADGSQRTVDNYLPSGSGSGDITNEFLSTNYALNSDYRFNNYIGSSNSLSPDSGTEYLIAAGKWFFEKDNDTATDVLYFDEFNAGQTDVPEDPKYFLYFECTSAGSAETQKDIILRMNDVRSFNSEIVSLSLEIKSSTSSTVDIRYKQYFGTGGTPSSDAEGSFQTINLGTSWARESIDGVTIPSISGKTIGTDENDYLELIIRLPLDQIFTVSITQFQFENRSVSSDYFYETYQVNKYRTFGSELPEILIGTDTGDTDYLVPSSQPDGTMSYTDGGIPVGTVIDRPTAAVPPGFLLCDGSSYNIAVDDPQYQRLYDVIGNTFGFGSDAFFATDVSTGVIRTICTSAGVSSLPSTSSCPAVTAAVELTGSTAYPFFVYNYSGSTQQEWVQFINEDFGVPILTPGLGASSTFTLLVSSAGSTYSKQKLAVTFVAASTIVTANDTIRICTPTVEYYFWANVDGAGVDPGLTGTGIEVALTYTDTATEVAQKYYNTTVGRQIVDLTIGDGSLYTAGDYFDLYNGTHLTRLHYIVDSVELTPSYTSSDFIKSISILSADDSATVAEATKIALQGLQFQVEDRRGVFVRGADNGRGWDPDAATRRSSNGTHESQYVGDNIGTYQYDENQEHIHSLPVQLTENVQPGTTSEEFWYSGAVDSAITDYSGGYEARPFNVYTNYFIKF